jgi:hypothetical protein
VHSVKGFVSLSNLINNTPGAIARLGELSTWSRTYSKEKGEYQDSGFSGYKLTTFRSINSTTGQMMVVPAIQVAQVFAIVQEALAYNNGRMRPFSPVDFRNTVLSSFYQRISDLEVGDFTDSGDISLPQWLQWRSLEANGAIIKIWLSDEAFQNQYDEYEIEVIKPVVNIDSLFGQFTTVTNNLAQTAAPALGDAIQAAKDMHPETYIRILNFDIVNQANRTMTYPSTWGVLIYGRNGDNVDAIKDAIIEEILLTSTRSRTEWESLIPSLFTRTEFIVLPRWDKISVPNLSTYADLYSVFHNPYESIQFARTAVPSVEVNYLQSNMSAGSFNYKGLVMLYVPGATNPQGMRKIEDIYHDFLPVPSSSMDFNRMRVVTRNWLVEMESLLIQAETATRYSGVPLTMRKQERDGVLYISSVINGVNYLVAARNNTFYHP